MVVVVVVVITIIIHSKMNSHRRDTVATMHSVFSGFQSPVTTVNHENCLPVFVVFL